MLKTRLWMGATLIVLFAVGLWLDEQWGPAPPNWLPPFPCWLIISVLAVIGCCREMRQLLRRRGIRLSRAISYGSVIGVALANWIPWLVGSNGPTDHLAWPFAAVCVANMVVLIREAVVYREPGESVTTAGAGMLLVFYLGVLATFAIELRWLGPGVLPIVALIAAAKCGDTGAYFGGRALGRIKLCPSLSPNKTVEGAVAGAIASVLGTWTVVAIGKMITGVQALSWQATVLFGLSVGVLAQVGDLIESLIKRDCQQKDASDLMPGFGGVLDVLDSPLFSAPLAFLLWIWLGPGWGAGLRSAN